MKTRRITLLVAAVVALVGGWALPLQAGLLLSYSGDAYQDPGAPNGQAWYGSSPYSGGSLMGTVDWLVFAPGEFPAALSDTSTFTPPAGELVYAYQINNTGTSDTSTLAVAIAAGSPADNIGSFPLDSGVPPGSGAGDVTLTPGASAYWFFSGGGITTGQSSIGLAYASPNTPEQEYGSLVNSGQGAFANPLPAPSTSPVPEPSTVILLAAAAVLLGLRRRFWCPV